MSLGNCTSSETWRLKQQRFFFGLISQEGKSPRFRCWYRALRFTPDRLGICLPMSIKPLYYSSLQSALCLRGFPIHGWLEPWMLRNPWTGRTHHTSFPVCATKGVPSPCHSLKCHLLRSLCLPSHGESTVHTTPRQSASAGLARTLVIWPHPHDVFKFIQKCVSSTMCVAL